MTAASWAATCTLGEGLTEKQTDTDLIALIELLAAAADALGYRQDAIANEAYLGTARRRRSVRPHRGVYRMMLGIGAVGIAAYILARRYCRHPARLDA